MKTARVEYDFTKPEDVARFKCEHVEVNEDAWLAQVAKMEADHSAITITDTKRYHLLETIQATLDNISKKLGK